MTIPVDHIAKSRPLIWRSRLLTFLKSPPPFVVSGSSHMLNAPLPPWAIPLHRISWICPCICRSRLITFLSPAPSFSEYGSSSIFSSPPHFAIPVHHILLDMPLHLPIPVDHMSYTHHHNWRSRLITYLGPAPFLFRFRFIAYLKRALSFGAPGCSQI